MDMYLLEQNSNLEFSYTNFRRLYFLLETKKFEQSSICVLIYMFIFIEESKKLLLISV